MEGRLTVIKHFTPPKISINYLKKWDLIYSKAFEA